MSDRITLAAGSVYCGVFPLALFLPFATYYMRLGDQSPRLSLAVFCPVLAAIYLANALLLRRGPALPVLAGVNGVLWTGGVAAILLTARVTGAGQILFALLLAAAGCILCVYTAFSPVTVPKLLTLCDCMAMAAVWMCLLEAGGAVPSSILLYYLAGLLAVLAALLALRTFGGGGVIYGSRLQGALLSLGLLAAIGGLLYLFIHFLSGVSRTAAAALFAAIGATLAQAWTAVEAFFAWLFRFWTPEEIDAAPLETVPLGSGDATADLEAIPLDPRLFWILGGILAVLLAAGLVFLLVRMRRTHFRAGSVTASAVRAEHHRAQGALARRLDQLWFRLRFLLACLLHPGSPTALLVWLEGWGRRHGRPRLPGETHRAFLLRLSAPEDPPVPALLDQLADALDARYFGGRTLRLPAKTASILRRHFRRRSVKNDPASPTGEAT